MKADLIIRGNLIAEKFSGGGNFYCLFPEEDLEIDEHSIVINGDVTVRSFEYGNMTVAVTGIATEKGGGHAN